MNELSLLELLIQTGFAGMFVYLFVSTQKETRARETRHDAERDEWQKERADRHTELVHLHVETMKIISQLTEAIKEITKSNEQLREKK